MLLYWKENNFKDKSKSLKSSLFLLRASSVSLIAFFLLNPFFENIIEEEKKPLLIIAQDLSQSVALSDKTNDKTEILEKIESLKSELGSSYDFRELNFGAEVNFGLTDSFTQTRTNFSDLFSFIEGQYYGLPISGLVVISDGIYNEGQNPIYEKSLANVPVYSIALGDTIKKSDISIKNVYHNKIGFLGDQIPIEFDISAQGYSSQKLDLSISEITSNGKQQIDSKSVPISGDNFFTSDRFIIPANKTGTRQFQISVTPKKNELSRSNNYRNIFLEIIDSRIDVLILANSPHPDIAALKQTLGSNKNYMIRSELLTDLKDLGIPDVVILHNLPSNSGKSKNILADLVQKKIPHLFIVGQQTIIPDFNESQEIVSIKTNLNTANEVQAKFNKNFNLFTIEDELIKDFEQMPPLTSPYGNYETQSDGKILLFQKIGNIETAYPLLAFNDRNGLKTATLLGEGLWKWKLNSYGKKGNYKAVDQLLLKSVQYLSLKEDKRKWQVQIEKNIWNENERIIFSATYYNDNFEPINNSEARMSIINESGDKYDYVFSRASNYYTLDAGYLPTGKYNFVAEADAPGEGNKYTGSFVIQDLQLEQTNLEARHDILFQLSENSGGKLYYPNEFELLRSDLKNKESKVVVFSSRTQSAIISIKWLFFLILGLISLEWILRRYHGSY